MSRTNGSSPGSVATREPVAQGFGHRTGKRQDRAYTYHGVYFRRRQWEWLEDRARELSRQQNERVNVSDVIEQILSQAIHAGESEEE